MAARRKVDRIRPEALAEAFDAELVETEYDFATEGRTYETAEQLLARIKSESPATNRPRRAAGRRTDVDVRSTA